MHPVYQVDRKHQFTEILKNLDTLKQQNYPVRGGVDIKQNFNEIEKKVTNLMD